MLVVVIVKCGKDNVGRNMEQRKFNPKRLYTLIKWIINVVCGLLFFLFILSILNYKEVETFYLDGHSRCLGQYQDALICQSYLESENQHERTTQYFGFFGIGIPIIFYGVTFLFRYLFPVNKEKN